jgi:energy-converting hydrogenase A subunit M
MDYCYELAKYEYYNYLSFIGDNVDEDEKLLEKMKLRILRSFKWKDDVVTPLADELKVSNEEMEKILMNHLDMSSLEALHPTLESAKPKCIAEKLHADLRLCWLCDVMEIISVEESNRIKMTLVKEIINGKNYDDALIDGKKQVVDLLLI